MAHPCPPRRSSDLWIDLGVVQLQPSELMKIALVLVLARYFHGLTWDEVGNPLSLIPPMLMVGMPVILVMRQPDLGTAVMIIMGAGTIFFLAGVRIWWFLRSEERWVGKECGRLCRFWWSRVNKK